MHAAAKFERRAPESGVPISNSIGITGPQSQGALMALRSLPRAEQFSALSQALALQRYCEEAGISAELGSAALHARIVAPQWTAEFDLRHESDAVAVVEAAAVCRLTNSDAGVAFDSEQFGDLRPALGAVGNACAEAWRRHDQAC